MLIYVLAGFLGALIVLAIYVRLSPIKAAQWHAQPPVAEVGTHRTAGSVLVIREVDAPRAVMNALDTVIIASPRTMRLAGTPEDGLVTYVTRSAAWGFPDLTTVAVENGVLRVYARLRFGKSDLGVNAARVTAWVDQVAPLPSQDGRP